MYFASEHQRRPAARRQQDRGHGLKPGSVTTITLQRDLNVLLFLIMHKQHSFRCEDTFIYFILALLLGMVPIGATILKQMLRLRRPAQGRPARLGWAGAG